MITIKYTFQTPHQYLFIHHHVKHLLLLWEKEQRKEIYIVTEEEEDHLQLKYPGETYIEVVLQEVEPVFFQTLETDEDNKPFSAILGATFSYQDKTIAMYYPHNRNIQQFYFFELKHEQIIELSENEYEAVAQTFMDQFPEYFSD